MAPGIRSAIVFIWIFMCMATTAASQVPDLVCFFETDSLDIRPGQTFSNKLVMENRSGRLLSLEADADGTQGQRGLIQVPGRFELPAGARRTYPVKYLANQGLIKSAVQRFAIRVREAGGTQAPVYAVFYTRLSQPGGLTLTSSQSEYYLNPQTGSVQLMIQCSNDGVLPADIRLYLSEVPDGLDFSLEQTLITLQPGARQLVPVQARSRGGNRQAVDFQVTIEARGPSGNTLASHRIAILNLSSVRRAGLTNGPFTKNLDNTVALRYISISNAASFYQAQADGRVDMSDKAVLKYRLNVDYYQQYLQGANVYDTYLDYETTKWGFKAGNIYENLDYALSGRGVKASLKFDEDRRLSVYGLQNNYMLLSGAAEALPGARILALSYGFKATPQQPARLTYLFSDDAYFGLRSHLLSGRTAYVLGKSGELGLEAGLSQEQHDSGPSKRGFAAGVNYLFVNQDWHISSSNYYSTPFFVGLRRGLLQSESRVLRTFGKGGHYGARLSLLDNQPAFQPSRNGFYLYSNRSRIYLYELSFGQRLGSFSFEVKPYLLQQKLDGMRYFDGLSPGFSWQSATARMQLQAAVSRRSHSLNLQTDYGYTFRNNTAVSGRQYHALRINGSYTNRYFGLNGYLQLNPYYLTDELATLTAEKFRILSFGPTTSFTALKERLQVQAAAQYNNYGSSRSGNYSVSGNVRWLIRGNWALTGDIFYTLVRQDTWNPVPGSYTAEMRFDTRQFRAGIEKRFAGISRGGGKKLELYYFEDQNSNGIADPGERPLSGLTIRANEETAITNAKGRVRFYNMKTGNYKIEVLNSQDWAMQTPLMLPLGKDRKIDIAVSKTIMLKGRLVLTGKQYLETSPELAGVRIQAEDRSGRKFETLTDAGGAYFLHLPEGSYQVFIETREMPFSIVNARNEITLASGSPQPQLDFGFRDERRKVEVVRF